MAKSDIAIDLSEFTEFVDMLNQDMVKITLDEAKKLLEQSLQFLEGNIAGHTPVNTGKLRSSIAHDIEVQRMGLRGIVESPLPYAMPVEKGRRAGRWPPIAAIRTWVIQKGIASGKQADSVAFLIARAIGTGTTSGIMRAGKGAKMFEKGFDASEPQIRRQWDRLPDRVIKRLSQ